MCSATRAKSQRFYFNIWAVVSVKYTVLKNYTHNNTTQRFYSILFGLFSAHSFKQDPNIRSGTLFQSVDPPG